MKIVLVEYLDTVPALEGTYWCSVEDRCINKFVSEQNRRVNYYALLTNKSIQVIILTKARLKSY